MNWRDGEKVSEPLLRLIEGVNKGKSLEVWEAQVHTKLGYW